MNSSSTRIVLANQPRLLRELIGRFIHTRPDLSLVGEVADLEVLASVIESVAADGLVVSANEAGVVDPRIWDVHRHHPRLRLFVLMPDGRRVRISPGGSEVRIGSIEDLAEAIRSATLPEAEAATVPGVSIAHGPGPSRRAAPAF